MCDTRCLISYQVMCFVEWERVKINRWVIPAIRLCQMSCFYQWVGYSRRDMPWASKTLNDLIRSSGQILIISENRQVFSFSRGRFFLLFWSPRGAIENRWYRTCQISAISIGCDSAKIARDRLVCPLPRKSSAIAGDQIRREERIKSPNVSLALHHTCIQSTNLKTYSTLFYKNAYTLAEPEDVLILAHTFS